MDTKTKLAFYKFFQNGVTEPLAFFLGLAGLFSILIGRTVGIGLNELYERKIDTEETCYQVFNTTFCTTILRNLGTDVSQLTVFRTCIKVCQSESVCKDTCERIFTNYRNAGSDVSPWEHPLVLLGAFFFFLSGLLVFFSEYSSSEVKRLTALLEEEEKQRKFELDGRAHKNV